MNKSDLINHVRTETGLKKDEASAALNAVLTGIAGALNEADTVALAGFGNFSVKDRPRLYGQTSTDRCGDSGAFPQGSPLQAGQSSQRIRQLT